MSIGHVNMAAQLASRPIANAAVTVCAEADGLRLRVPLNRPTWTRLVRHVFPLSSHRELVLDDLGAQVFRMCDGEHTIEEIVDRFMHDWHLSFFEARGMVLQFLSSLLRHTFVIVVAPPGHGGTGTRRNGPCAATHP